MTEKKGLEIEVSENGWLIKHGNLTCELKEAELKQDPEKTITKVLEELKLEVSNENIAKLKNAIKEFAEQIEKTEISAKATKKAVFISLRQDGEEIANLRVSIEKLEEEKETAIKKALEKAKVPNALAYAKKVYFEALRALQEAKNRRFVVFENLETAEGRVLVQEVFDYETQKFGLLVYNQKNNSFEIVEKFKVGDETWLPQPIPISKLRKMPRVILASEPQDFGDIKSLMNEIEQFIIRYVDLEKRHLWFIVRFVLHTWIYDCGDYAEQAQALGDFGSGKTRLFKILRLLCYNALAVAGGSTLSAYKRLQSKFAGTLLVNEFEQYENSEDASMLIQWLNGGFERDLPIALSDKLNPEKQRFFDPFGPKFFTSRNRIENVAARSRLVIIEMQKSNRPDIPINLPDEAYEEAKILRNKLLAFRMRFWQPNFKLPQDIYDMLQNDQTIDGRFKQVALPLLILAAIINDKDEVAEVFNFYRRASQEFKKEIATQTAEGLLFNTIVELCKQDSYDASEFLGVIDENYKLIAITTSLLQKRTGFSARTIAKALQRIGMVQERTTKEVIVSVEEREPILKNKVLRKWVFNDERSWYLASSRYYYNEQINENSESYPPIPDVIKSNTFIPLENKNTEKFMPLMPDMPDLRTGASNSNSSLERKTATSNNLENKQTKHEEKSVAVHRSGISGISGINQETKAPQTEPKDKVAKICANCKHWDLPPGCEATVGTCTLTGQGTPKGHSCPSFVPKEAS